MDEDFLSYLQGRSGGFQPYAAGNKVYGGGRSMPNLGPTSSPQGYRERDLKAKAMRNATLKRMQAGQQGNYMSSAWLKPPGGGF